MNLKNLQQGNDMLLMIKIIKSTVEEMKILQPLKLKLRLLNQLFVIIQAHIFL